MKEQVLEILLDVVPDVDFENEVDLVADKLIDSFAVVAMVNELNDAGAKVARLPECDGKISIKSALEYLAASHGVLTLMESFCSIPGTV